jgi:hypothetical protein
MEPTVRLIITTITLLLIAGCSSNISGGSNDTAYDYIIDEQQLAKREIKKVILAPNPLYVPTLSHLRAGEKKVKSEVAAYLEANGYELLPDYHFKNAWNQATRSYGDPYDPTTGRVDERSWQQAMVITGRNLREQTDFDAIIFADVVEHPVQHTANMKHYARWFGVTRKPAMVGIGNSVPADFDWSAEVKAASLRVTVFDRDLHTVFSSFGGIDTTQGIDMRSSNPTFVRRKKLLKSESFIEEGIEIGFHPFIVMDNYPGKTQAQRRAEIAAEKAKQLPR